MRGDPATCGHIYLTTIKVLKNGNCTKYWAPSWEASCPATGCNSANDGFNCLDKYSKQKKWREGKAL